MFTSFACGGSRQFFIYNDGFVQTKYSESFYPRQSNEEWVVVIFQSIRTQQRGSGCNFHAPKKIVLS